MNAGPPKGQALGYTWRDIPEQKGKTDEVAVQKADEVAICLFQTNEHVPGARKISKKTSKLLHWIDHRTFKAHSMLASLLSAPMLSAPYTCIYIYIYTHAHAYIYIYICILGGLVFVPRRCYFQNISLTNKSSSWYQRDQRMEPQQHFKAHSMLVSLLYAPMLSAPHNFVYFCPFRRVQGTARGAGGVVFLVFLYMRPRRCSRRPRCVLRMFRGGARGARGVFSLFRSVRGAAEPVAYNTIDELGTHLHASVSRLAW